MGNLLTKANQPALYEEHKAKLEACKTWDELSALTESLMQAKRGGGPPVVIPPITESNQPPKPGAPKPPAPAPKPPITEAKVHPGLAMARGMRGRK